MEQETPRLKPSEPLEKVGLEQKLQKKLNDAISFDDSIDHTKKMIAYYKDKNHKSKKKHKKYTKQTTKL